MGVAYGDDHGAAARVDVVFRGEPQTALVLVPFADDGLITSVTDWWPEPCDPPSGREHLTERS